MRAVVQRVKCSQVAVEGKTVSSIGEGMNVLIGIENTDTDSDIAYIAEKLLNIRIFSDSDGKLNLSVKDTLGEILLVSQFTLLADARKGRRPSFDKSMAYNEGKILFEKLVELLKKSGLKIETGVYGADMQVDIQNDGPVTILLDSKKLF